ncbi:hypothetical protein FA15DRAFT_658951 [Coprinopsis marcescibilis]|uniref:Uncharacterized protein n=1 Tax=Coprinopsis marcescibilis TaxID=230819 RepID=A0A5C3KKW3_COPMA|nr:hypothetical protein FA15DRAFT_658951 [Coprinopsis marcescibilis]
MWTVLSAPLVPFLFFFPQGPGWFLHFATPLSRVFICVRSTLAEDYIGASSLRSYGAALRAYCYLPRLLRSFTLEFFAPPTFLGEWATRLSPGDGGWVAVGARVAMGLGDRCMYLCGSLAAKTIQPALAERARAREAPTFSSLPNRPGRLNDRAKIFFARNKPEWVYDDCLTERWRGSTGGERALNLMGLGLPFKKRKEIRCLAQPCKLSIVLPTNSMGNAYEFSADRIPSALLFWEACVRRGAFACLARRETRLRKGLTVSAALSSSSSIKLFENPNMLDDRGPRAFTAAPSGSDGPKASREGCEENKDANGFAATQGPNLAGIMLQTTGSDIPPYPPHHPPNLHTHSLDKFSAVMLASRGNVRRMSLWKKHTQPCKWVTAVWNLKSWVGARWVAFSESHLGLNPIPLDYERISDITGGRYIGWDACKFHHVSSPLCGKTPIEMATAVRQFNWPLLRRDRLWVTEKTWANSD